jgi:hypothetical protein
MYHPGQVYGFSLIILFWIVWTPGCATPPDIPAANIVLKDIRVVDTEVNFELARPRTQDFSYTAVRSVDPLRLVLRFFDTLAWDVSSPMTVANETIDKIEIVTLVNISSQILTRIEIALKQDTGFSIDVRREKIRLTFLLDQHPLQDATDQVGPIVPNEDEVQ